MTSEKLKNDLDLLEGFMLVCNTIGFTTLAIYFLVPPQYIFRVLLFISMVSLATATVIYFGVLSFLAGRK